MFGSSIKSRRIKEDVTVRALIKESFIDGRLLLTCVNALALRLGGISNGSTRVAFPEIIIHLRQLSPRYTQHCMGERRLVNYEPYRLINNELIYGPPDFPLRLKRCMIAVLDDMIAWNVVSSKPRYWFFEIGCISATRRKNTPFKSALRHWTLSTS